MPPSEITATGSETTTPTKSTNYLDDALKRSPKVVALAEKPGEYKAFHIEKRPETLEIRLTPDDGEIFDYMLVKNTSYRLSKSPQRITVYTSAGRLVLTGRNLRELVEGFRRRGVAYVQAFDAARHTALKDDAPCIEAIAFWPVDGKKPVPKTAASSPKDDAD